MAIFYRRILDDEPQYDPYLKCDDNECSTKDGNGSKSNLPFSPILLIVICFLVAIFFLICYFIILKKYRFHLNSLRRTFSRNIDQTDENIMNQDHGPELIHPIWLINTVGLTQMVIDSIAIVKYKKGEGMIEETDCSICLSEFQEDESVRLLPKCSHAFHIACIDTWLRSHKNCPLCRAPIVVETSTVGLSTVETTNTDGLSAGEDDLVENSDGNTEDCDGDGDGNSGAVELTASNEEASENIDKTLVYHSVRNFDVGVESAKGEGGSQEVRRSVSLDSFSASMIHIAVANIDQVKAVKHGKNNSLSRIYGVMKSSSFRHFSEKGHISMKRTFSSTGRKWPKPRSSKSHDSILPL